MSAPLLSVENLQVSFRLGRQDGQLRRAQAVGRDGRGVSFAVPEHCTVALVGESGSGKTVTAMSIPRLLPDNAEPSGQVRFQGRDLLRASAAELRALRGAAIACVFQDPMSSLNPVFPIGRQIAEPLRLHLGLSRRAAWARAEQLLEEVGLPEPRRRLEAFPHELSGGQQQRVMIAMALACEPKLLIADEPTTALDVTIQRQILELLADLKQRRRMSMLFISHDLGVVGEIADEVVVMRHGLVREQGPVARIFSAPQDAYTRALLACRPRLDHNPRRLTVIDDHIAAQAPGQPASAAAADEPEAPPASAPAVRDPAAPVVLEVRGLAKSFFLREGLFGRREFKAVQDVNFQLRRGHTLGVVGESGSGKTTMGLTLLRLHEPTAGEVIFDGRNLLTLQGPERQALRRRIQVVFQNPYASLNPRFTIGQTLLEPMRIHAVGADDAEREARALALLQRVGLDGTAFGKYPHEFSGGQRQRIAIARALTLSPQVLILDEAVSALDVSVQAQVLNLLRDLQDELGLAYVFISHDLAVVRFISDEVLVMKDGRVVERAGAAELLAAPREDYTRRLLAAVPRGWTGAAA
ncbi:MAG: dipeptide ABC transporter ATP-binding protein [Burkholderiaceae bacterium]|nr:dipeptide ABC transporter ATP-binding protein [Burkholderiaceae bacterium]